MKVLFKNYKESFLQRWQVDFQIYLHGLDGLINFQESSRFGQNHISSTAAVQQGDPLGPLLFSLSIWYLDDGTFNGKRDSVSNFLNLIISKGTCSI